MDNRTISKIGTFFSGLVSRMEENKEYFREMRIDLRSGTKSFPAKIYFDNDNLMLSFNAVKKRIDIKDLWNEVSGLLSDYDSAVAEYDERGTGIRITADRKQVKLSHFENIPKQEEAKAIAAVSSERSYIVNPALEKELLS